MAKRDLKSWARAWVSFFTWHAAKAKSQPRPSPNAKNVSAIGTPEQLPHELLVPKARSARKPRIREMSRVLFLVARGFRHIYIYIYICPVSLLEDLFLLKCFFCFNGVFACLFGICAFFEDWRAFGRQSNSALLVETIDTALLIPVPAQLFVEVSYGYILTIIALLLSQPRHCLGMHSVAHIWHPAKVPPITWT